MTFYSLKRGMLFCISLLVAFSGLTRAYAQNKLPVDRPIRVCVLQDKSGSMQSTRTPQFSRVHSDMLTSFVSDRAGEIAYANITEESNFPLVRYYVPDLEAPKMPEMKGNARQKREMQERYKKTALYYLLARKRRAEKSAEDLNTFYAQAVPLFLRDADAGSTDIWGGLHRCRNMMIESTGSWNNTPRDYVFVITDAVHTSATSEIKKLPSQVNLFLVYNAMTIGSFGNHRFRQFESIDAALRELLADISRREVSP